MSPSSFELYNGSSVSLASVVTILARRHPRHPGGSNFSSRAPERMMFTPIVSGIMYLLTQNHAHADRAAADHFPGFQAGDAKRLEEQ